MKTQVIVVNGLPKSGKDTFAEILNEYAVVEKLSIIDLAKEIAVLSGWDGIKSDRSRQFLFEIKELVDEFSDASHNYIDKKVLEILDRKTCDFILIDAREEKDITRLVKKSNAITVEITNNRVKHIPTNRADMAVKGKPIEYDIVISNDGTLDDFRRKIYRFYEIHRYMKLLCKDTKITDLYVNSDRLCGMDIDGDKF